MENKENQRFKTLKGFILGVILSLAVFCLYHLIVAFAVPADTPSSPASFDKIKQIENTIDEHYMGEIDKQEMTDVMFLGIVAGLEDRYSTYYTAEEYEDVTSVQSGYFEGIGIEINRDDETGKLIVVNVYEDAPADRSGMLEGDLLITINGTDVTDYTAAEAVELIQADETGTINITVLRDGEMIDLSMKPEKILRNPVKSEILEGNIGYIKIGTFDNLTAEEFKSELDRCMEAGVKGIIIDLRSNLGGLVSAACDSLREFMPEGLLVYTENKYGERKEYNCDGENELDIPMAVLVNSKTASSAEIFSGAVKDYDRAVIIGTQTFGKGIVQDSFKLSDGSVVKLTVAHYYTPDGNDIHGQGITPDIVVEDEDEQLEKAIEVLSE